MTRSHLRACPSCARHVRVYEKTCPFCGGPLAEPFRATPSAQAPGVRLTRAALFAFGTGAAALSPGCSSSTTSTGSPADAGTDTGQVAPPYGGPPLQPDAGHDAGNAARADAGGSDAGTDAPLLFDAAYGGPPLDSGGD